MRDKRVIDETRNACMQYRMDWRTIRFDWNRARAFLVTAEEGSFSAAAKALGMTQPTLGRQVDALEQELGVALFERIGRGLMLTPSGLELIEHVRAMGEAASGLSLAASGQMQGLEGNVAISASEITAVGLLPPIIARLRREYPGLGLEIVPSNEAVDLRRREADIAIRNFRPTQNDLIARKIRDDFGHLYATPEYIDSIGNPQTTADLSHAQFIGFTPQTRAEMIERFPEFGIQIDASNMAVLAGNHTTHWELCKQGLGIGIVPQKLGDSEPLVRRVLPDATPMTFPVWLTTHRELRTSRRVRVVFDVLAEELARP